MTTFVRAAVIADFPAVALQAGLDPRQELRRAGIDPGVCSRPDQQVPADRVGWLLESAAERSGLPDFAIRLAMRRQAAHLGVAGLVLTQQRTVREALAMAQRYRQLLNPALAMMVEETGDTAIVRLDLSLGGSRAWPQSTDLAVAAVAQLFWLLLDPGWRPQAVHLAHPAPPGPTLHRRHFGCAVVFDSAFNGLVCTAADLDRVNPRADSGLAHYARTLLDALPGGAAQPLAATVGQLIRLLLPMGTATLAAVARTLGTTPRTLQRDLAAAGTSFAALLAETRGALCRELLADRQLPVARIAEQLGYAAAPAFIRWFRSAFGTTPQRWRSRQPAAEPGR